MPAVRRFGPLDFVALLIVLAVAGTARVGYLIVYCDSAANAGPLAVEDVSPVLDDLPPGTKLRGREHATELDALIHNVKENNWFGSFAPFSAREEATAHVAPGYAYLLGFAARYAPEESFDRLVRWTQAGLGTLTALFVFLFGRRVFRSLFVGTLAGLFMAAWPFAVIDTAALADGTLATFLLSAGLWLGARAGTTGGPLASLLFGLTLAGLALTRAALLPYAVLCLAWLLVTTRDQSSGWVSALVAFLGFVAGLAPWTVRNYQTFNEPVPIVSSSYYELWVGNNPAATGGPVDEAMLEKVPGPDLAAIASQPDRYATLARKIAQEAQDAPTATVQRRVNALLYFLFGQHWFTNQRLADPLTSGGLDHAELILASSLLGAFLFAFLGWRWSFPYKREMIPASLAVIWLPLPYILGHAMGLHGPRLPLDPVILCLAAFALACFVPGVSRSLLEPKEREDEE
jgi:hypothetical protein